VTIEELEAALSATITSYAAQLSHVKDFTVDNLRLEVRGQGISVMYDRAAPGGMPTLVVSITQPTPEGERFVDETRRRFLGRDS
jgi:hypothetical protein